MGIKQEIERLELAEQARRDEETRQKKQLIQQIEIKEKQLWTTAKDFIIPFAQKLQESGTVEILDELRKVEDLRKYKGEWHRGFFGEAFHKDPSPAELEIRFKVSIGKQSFSFSGFNFEQGSGPKIPDKAMAIGQLREYYAEITSAENSEIKTEECLTELIWNYKNLGYIEGCEYDHLCFFLSRRENLYILEITGGESFQEPWSTKQLEQVVARVYLSDHTHIKKGGHSDIGS